MVLWITGNSGAGKTTIAKQLKTRNCVILDGDDMRGVYPTGFSEEERTEHNLRIAKLAKLFHDQGLDVIVSVICPYKTLRKQVQEICGCSFLYLKTEDKEGYPYEYEDDKYYLSQLK